MQWSSRAAGHLGPISKEDFGGGGQKRLNKGDRSDRKKRLRDNVIKEKIKQIGQSGSFCYKSPTWKWCSGREQEKSETADSQLLSENSKCEQKFA